MELCHLLVVGLLLGPLVGLLALPPLPGGRALTPATQLAAQVPLALGALLPLNLGVKLLLQLGLQGRNSICI